MINFGKGHAFTLKNLESIIYGSAPVGIADDARPRLRETRTFVAHLLKNNIKVYGLTTGFADLRNQAINPAQAAMLSCNLMESHDAGIGAYLSDEIVVGAMAARASSLAQGHSAIQEATLDTLVAMINARIIPLIPKTGSLGASGDLAFLARMGRAMQGTDAPVTYRGQVMTSAEALRLAKIRPFVPEAKEGLAITNGTSFMVSMIGIAYLREVRILDNLLVLQGLFLNAVGAIDAAFNSCIQDVRGQTGQLLVAKMLSRHFRHSSHIDRTGVQDDYCIRCLPQILGPKLETILEQYPKIQRELNAVTDNPLFFKGDEISEDVDRSRLIEFQGDRWAILSGGNFHGECITAVADAIAASNAKIALTLERQIAYMLNPHRNKGRLPCYLIKDTANAGLLSGYMITQYAANALAQKIAQLGTPTAIFNITSANESEDIVSYGATAAERLLEQVGLLEELMAIYLSVSVQAYSLVRTVEHPESLSEVVFQFIQAESGNCYPFTKEENFDGRYKLAQYILTSGALPTLANFSVLSDCASPSQQPTYVQS